MALWWEGADRQLILSIAAVRQRRNFAELWQWRFIMKMRSRSRWRSGLRWLKRYVLLRPWVLQVILFIIRLILDKALK